ncbi:YitT family protein [Gottschalkiaceae bacterium SANA]|nr:YitT family protein [Gottschalkiaceae bacterium SANA]
MKNNLMEYTLITIGAFLVAMGVYFFLVPSNLAVGGVSGLAIVLKAFLPEANIGVLSLMMNGILFVIGFTFIGVGFGAKTIFSSMAISFFLGMMEILYPMQQPFSDDLFLVLVMGVLVSGVGIAIVFNQNASTGGTDIIAKILNKYFKISIGVGLFIADFFIVLAAGYVFGIEVFMYAFIGLILNGTVIDNMIEGFNTCVEVMIISRESQTIQKYVIESMERGVTVYQATGGYTKEQKEVLLTVVGKREFIQLRKFIKQIDRSAFITTKKAHEILGEGFSELD